MTFHQQQVAILRMSHTERREELMRELRVKLGQAYICAAWGEDELAAAYVGVGANKLAQAVRIDANVIAMVQA